MEVPVRKVKVGRKWRRVEIYTPDPYTVSSKKFDYPTYVEELIDEQTAPISTEPDPDLLALFQMKKHEPETDPDKLLYDVKKAALDNSYSSIMLKLQYLYEESVADNWETDIHINELMKEVAEDYVTALNMIDQNYEHHLQSNPSPLNGIVDPHQSVEKLVAKKREQKIKAEHQAEEERLRREEIQRQSLERVHAYHDGLITPSDLKAYDIRNLPESDKELRFGARKIINEVYQMVPNYQEYSMGDLYSLYTSLEHQQPKVSNNQEPKGKSR